MGMVPLRLMEPPQGRRPNGTTRRTRPLFGLLLLLSTCLSLVTTPIFALRHANITERASYKPFTGSLDTRSSIKVKRQARPLKLFLQAPADLQHTAKSASRDGSDPWPNVLQWLKEDSDMAFAAPIVGIWDEKQGPGDSAWNDFVSLAPYWWPNPDSPDGMPYTRRDGFTNPEVNDWPDKGKLVTNVCSYTIYLAYAYYFSTAAPWAFSQSPDDYASRAIAQLRAWFVDFETAMTPNMRFAQIRPGRPPAVEDGAVGILDLTRSIRFVEAISILSTHPWMFDAELNQGLRRWFSSMLDWLENSPAGRKSRSYQNNLGIYYDAFIGILKLYLGRDDAADWINSACQNRLDNQVDWGSGEMPAETARSDSLHYTFYALQGLLNLALLSDRVYDGNEIAWGASNFGKGSCWQHPNFKRAMAYPLPAVLNNDPGYWPHGLDGGRKFKPSEGWPLYVACYYAFGNDLGFGDAAVQWSRAGGTGDWLTRITLPTGASLGATQLRKDTKSSAKHPKNGEPTGENMLTTGDRDNIQYHSIVGAGAVEVECDKSSKKKGGKIPVGCLLVDTEKGQRKVVVQKRSA